MQRRMTVFTFALGLALVFASSAALAQYQLSNLSSNQVKFAHHDDPLLVNAWGLVHGAGSPWWVRDENSGWSTLYDAAGNTIQQVKVLIPTAGNGPSSPQGLNGPGSPTEIVHNGSQEFQVGGWPSIFLFSTLDGTISGWAPQTNFNQAVLAPLQNQPTGAVYTGLAITNKATGNFLYAADLANSQVEIFDANFKFVKAFTDATLPAGFAPFGVRDINGIVYVTFASATGASGGFVGRVKDNTGKAIVIDQLWGIDFGDGLGKNGPANHLFFTAGPSGNLAGTFGVIVFKPSIRRVSDEAARRGSLFNCAES